VGVLSKKFASVFTIEDPASAFLFFGKRTNKALSDLELIERVVLRRLEGLDSNLSAGGHEFHPRVLRLCASGLALPFSLLFRRSLDLISKE